MKFAIIQNGRSEMGITIGRYTFEGPYSFSSSLEDKAGVYAILCDAGEEFRVIDVGESAIVRTRVETHDRKDCWTRNCSTSPKYAAHYTPGMQQQGRMRIEQEIRDAYDPPCGKA